MNQVVGLAHKQQFMTFYIGSNSELMTFYIGNNLEKTSYLTYSWFQAKYTDLVDRGDIGLHIVIFYLNCPKESGKLIKGAKLRW